MIPKCYKKSRVRKRRAKRDSGGLCIFIKDSLDSFFSLIEWENEDGFLFKISKNCMPTESLKDVCVIFTYLKPQSSTRNNLNNVDDSFDILSSKVQKLRENNEIIFFGDLNSRTSTLNETLDNNFGNFDPFF